MIAFWSPHPPFFPTPRPASVGMEGGGCPPCSKHPPPRLLTCTRGAAAAASRRGGGAWPGRAEPCRAGGVWGSPASLPRHGPAPPSPPSPGITDINSSPYGLISQAPSRRGTEEGGAVGEGGGDGGEAARG